MAQYKIKEPEELSECPYDAVHMIRTKRFQYHLMKCRKNYTGSDYVRCPFNACHEIPRPELKYHISNCADKVQIERDLLYCQTQNKGEGTYFRGVTEIPELHTQYIPPSKECWDDEVSPFVVQVVDKAVFTGNYHDLETGKLSQNDKKSLMDRIKQRGIPLADPQSSDDGSALRLPHRPPLVLDAGVRTAPSKSVKFGPKPTVTYDRDDDEDDKMSTSDISRNVALLQSLARGRGRIVPCAEEITPKVGRES